MSKISQALFLDKIAVIEETLPLISAVLQVNNNVNNFPMLAEIKRKQLVKSDKSLSYDESKRRTHGAALAGGLGGTFAGGLLGAPFGVPGIAIGSLVGNLAGSFTGLYAGAAGNGAQHIFPTLGGAAAGAGLGALLSEQLSHGDDKVFKAGIGLGAVGGGLTGYLLSKHFAE